MVESPSSMAETGPEPFLRLGVDEAIALLWRRTLRGSQTLLALRVPVLGLRC